MKCFEIAIPGVMEGLTEQLTVNMKCFEIISLYNCFQLLPSINRKHEMFWNNLDLPFNFALKELTVNMKCFEILIVLFFQVVIFH